MPYISVIRCIHPLCISWIASLSHVVYSCLNKSQTGPDKEASLADYCMSSRRPATETEGLTMLLAAPVSVELRFRVRLTSASDTVVRVSVKKLGICFTA